MSEKNIFETKIEFIKGVGPKRATILNKELGVYKFSDLIEYFPFASDKLDILNSSI